MQSSWRTDRTKFEEQPHAVLSTNGGQNSRNNPMQSGTVPRRICGARTRNGTPCLTPAMPNGRCRMHGGLSPGAPKGNLHARKHGYYGADEISRRRKIAALLRRMRTLAAAVTSREE